MSKEFKEWFKVIEIADMLGFSKVTVYSKIKAINSETLQPLQKKEKGITYYNFKIIDLLRADHQDTPKVKNIQEEIAADYIEGNYKELYISQLKSENDFLRDQIKELNNRLAQEQELNKNNQILQLKQPANIQQLEQHFIELNDKINSVKSEMTQRQEEYKQDIKESKKSPLQRLLRSFNNKKI